MNLKEKSFESQVGCIHEDFSIQSGHWFWNKNPDKYVGQPDIKIVFFFNDGDKTKLNNCDYIAKVGLNTDEANPNPNPNPNYKYVGFCYAKNDQKNNLLTFGQRFNSSRLIEKLNSNWEEVPTSENE